jgi:hypothetical protein
VCDQTRGPTSILMNMAAEEAAGGLLCGGKRNPAGVTSPWNAKSQHVATKNRRRGGAWLAKQNRDTAIADKPVTPKNTTF